MFYIHVDSKYREKRRKYAYGSFFVESSQRSLLHARIIHTEARKKEKSIYASLTAQSQSVYGKTAKVAIHVRQQNGKHGHRHQFSSIRRYKVCVDHTERVIKVWGVENWGV